jgi:hypothetical protein
MPHMTTPVTLRCAAVLAAATALIPGAMAAQRLPDTQPTNRFNVGLYAGAYFDRTYVGAIDGGPTPLGGLRVAYALSGRTRVLADVGFTDLDAVARVGNEDSYVVWGASQWLTSAGVEVDLLPGRTGISAGLEFGAITGDEEVEQVVGSHVREDFYPDRGSSTSVVAVPAIAARHAFTRRAQLRLSLRDYIVIDNTPWKQNIALTLGLSLR